MRKNKILTKTVDCQTLRDFWPFVFLIAPFKFTLSDKQKFTRSPLFESDTNFLTSQIWLYRSSPGLSDTRGQSVLKSALRKVTRLPLFWYPLKLTLAQKRAEIRFTGVHPEPKTLGLPPARYSLTRV